MVKKAIVSTVIFTLIIINLIMWPTLFSDFKEGNVEVGGEGESVESESDLGLNEDIDSSLTGEVSGEAGVEDEEDEDASSELASKKKVFKILRIE